MIYFIISIFVIVIILMLSAQKISSYFENRQELQEIDFKERTNLDLWKLTKISSRIFMFGLEKYFINTSDFYFDDKNLYLIIYNKPIIKHSVSDIIEVSKTPISINKSKIWKIIIDDLKEKKVYKFIPNDSLSNSNFSMFLDKVNENSNSIVDSSLF